MYSPRTTPSKAHHFSTFTLLSTITARVTNTLFGSTDLPDLSDFIIHT